MGDYKKNQLSTKKIWLLVIVGSLIIAILSHLYFIYQKSDGILMAGFNDGLSQMIPFKKFIYDAYTSGNFFYSDSFGLGGGIYSQLGYYYSTNLFFLFYVVIIFLLEILGVIEHPDITFWANAILPMSIFKITIALIVTIYYFRQIKFGFLASFLGAVVYAVNVLYFRHTMYWDFFSDAFVWFILLLIGIEKIIQKKSGKLFVIAVVCNLITNFYFSYINFILALFYILLRFPIRFFNDEEKVSKQLIRYISLGIIGFLISSFAFIPAVMGYLDNYRPEFSDSIPLFTLTDNILFNSRVMFLPIFIIILVCIRKFYKHPIFRFFAITSIIGTILHFIPAVGSMFNGFSAPQNRWEHIVGLAYGGITAFTFHYIKQIKLRHISIGVGLYLFVSIGIVWWDDFEFDRPIRFVIPILSFMMVIILLGMKRFSSTKQKRIFFVSVTLFMMLIANTFQSARLMIPPKDKVLASEAVMQSGHYNSKEQRNILENLEQRTDIENFRIDWMVPTRNNTPIVQDYDGFSIYSSILNQNLLFFYYDRLQISMEEESVSRYDGMGDRTNLLSILNGQFYMRDKAIEKVPYGFNKILESENYHVYENEWLLPNFRKTNTLFSEEEFINQPILTREHAMLKGAIVDKQKSTDKLPDSKEITDYNIKLINANYDDKALEVKEENGGVEITLTDSVEAGDLYLSFYLEGIKNNDKYVLKVNEFQTIRKEADSIYRTGYNDLTLRVTASDKIQIKLPKGTYQLEDFHIFHEDYQYLKNAYIEYADERLSIKWNNGRVEGDVVSEEKDELIVTPIPYEKGWHLQINGKYVPMEKVNYAFIGIPLEEGMNDIKMVYLPPYFGISCLLSIIGVSLFWYLVRKRKRRVSDSNKET